MDDITAYKALKKAISWLLLATALLFLLTGFGIVYPDIVGPLTLGILYKGLSIRLHDVLWAPFLALLIAHLGFRYMKKI